MTRTVVAVDLGAESGRVTTVDFDGRRLSLDVIRRFGHEPSRRDGALRWDLEGLWSEIAAGLATLAGGPRPVDSVGVDSWGVDYGLLTAHGDLVDDPTCYRDPRNVAAFDRAMAALGPERLYRATGSQLLEINTVFALAADAHDHPERLERASTLLMLPDVFHHRLSGSRVTEFSAVSTTGAYDMARGRWATDLLDDLGIPTHFLPEVVPAGTDVGPLRGPLADGALAGARVILPAGHDTASAVVAAPLQHPDGLYVSSGTWSLAGVEVAAPIITEQTRATNITNEGGYGGTIRLLRNVMGLWILQECRRQWAREGREYSYPELAELAAAAPGFAGIINPDDREFLPPGDMPDRIRRACARHGLPVPQTVGEVARCVIDSLALAYRLIVEDLELVTGRRPPSISIVGGGSNHTLLSRLTANATGLPVRCGPVEATALGNAAVQLAALGEFSGPDEIRRVIADSVSPVDHDPVPDSRWDAAAARLRSLRAATS